MIKRVLFDSLSKQAELHSRKTQEMQLQTEIVKKRLYILYILSLILMKSLICS